jgi:hypothetical protein
MLVGISLEPECLRLVHRINLVLDATQAVRKKTVVVNSYESVGLEVAEVQERAARVVTTRRWERLSTPGVDPCTSIAWISQPADITFERARWQSLMACNLPSGRAIRLPLAVRFR